MTSAEQRIADLYGVIEDALRAGQDTADLTAELRQLQQAEADRMDAEFHAKYPAVEEVRELLAASRKLRSKKKPGAPK